MSGRAGFSVSLLGPLEVHRDGVPLAIPGARSAVVLAVLAMSAGQPVPVQRLAERVWGEVLPERIHGSLHSHVLRLRRALGQDIIGTVPSGYVLDLEPDQVDVLRFRRLVAQASTAEPDRATELLDEALALWRGEPLAGLQSRELETEVVPSLVEERMEALERRIDIGLAAGRHAGVIADLRTLVGRFPLREPLWRRLILALAGSGRQAEAIEAYHDVRARLRDDLGLDPSPELQDLYRQLLSGDPMAGSGEAASAGTAWWRRDAPPQQLPAGVGQFTGRRAELQSLDRLLAEQPPTAERSLLVALVGTAGAGKTTLALHWARQVVDRFADGQLWVNLHGFGPAPPADPAAVLDTFLRALGTPPERIPAGADARAALFRTVTTGRRLLIVADNARDTDQVRPLLPGPGNLLIVSSRSQLRGLIALDGAHRVTVDQLPAGDAAALLERVLGADRIAGQEKAVARLVELCVRLPLALTIAAEHAARQPDVPLSDLVDELHQEQSRLDSLATGEDTATDLRAVFSWSYGHLDADTRRTFRRMGLHPGAVVSLPVVAALAGLAIPAVRSHLDRLAAVHLVERRSRDRYTFHDLLRVYAAERAAEEESGADREAMVERVLDWYLHTAARAVFLQWYGTSRYRPLELPPPDPQVTPLAFADAAVAQAWLETTRANLIAATAYAAGHGRDLHASLTAEVTRRYLFQGSWWHDLMDLTQVALPAARRLGDCLAEADLLRDLGIANAVLGEADTARAHFQTALGISRAAGYRLGEAQNLNDLGHVEETQGRFREALAYSTQGLEVCQASGDRLGEAFALNSMAMYLIGLGEQEAALARGHDAQAILEGIDDVWTPRAQAHVFDTIGQAYAGLARHEEAIDAYRRALAAIDGLADRRGEAIIRANLGRTLRAIGDTDGALTNWEQALKLLSFLRDPLAEEVEAEIAGLELQP